MIIAERVLTFKDSDSTKNIHIEINCPEKSDGMSICRYKIGWPDAERNSYAAGVDFIQALHSALQKIGLEIYSSAYHKSGLLYWEKIGQGYGFPVPKNARDLLIGEDKIFEGE